MSQYIHPAQRAVDDAYRRTRGPVALLDESYSAPAEGGPGRATFYVFSSVLVRVKDMDVLRGGLGDIAESDFWHTSDALKQCYQALAVALAVGRPGV